VGEIDKDPWMFLAFLAAMALLAELRRRLSRVRP
jgi:hypothetical protein